MKYIIILSFMLGCCIGCTKDFCPRVPKPLAPPMKAVHIKNNAIQGEDLSNVISNMVNLQQYVDELSLCPCWED